MSDIYPVESSVPSFFQGIYDEGDLGRKSLLKRVQNAVARAMPTPANWRRLCSCLSFSIGSYCVYQGFFSGNSGLAQPFIGLSGVVILGGVVSFIALKILGLIGDSGSAEEASFGTTFIDLNDKTRDLALKEELPFLPSRKTETELLKAALLSFDKPNVVLVGPAGSGKTTLVEQFAKQIARGESPPFEGCRVIEISIGEFVKDSPYIGCFESKIHRLITDLQKQENHHLILFVDEIHALFSVGSVSGGSGTYLRDLLKPLLSSGKVRLIGCTTEKEYQILAQDEAFARRFSVVKVPEPTGELLEKIIRAKVQLFANRFRCVYTDSAIQAAMQVASSLPGYNPDKSLTLLDQVGAWTACQGKQMVTAEEVFALLGERKIFVPRK